MSGFIAKVEIIGLHDRFNICQEFNSGTNVIYGENGDFKTTLLHVIANMANNDPGRFLYLNFNKILIHMSDGYTISIGWRSHNRNKMLVTRSDYRQEIAEFKKDTEGSPPKIKPNSNPLPSCAYFPTSRTVIEAWFSIKRRQSLEEDALRAEMTGFLRNMFGQFMPEINFTPVPEILTNLKKDFKKAHGAAVRADQKILAESFYKAIDVSLSKPTDFFKSDKDIKNRIAKISEINSKLERYSIYPYLQLPEVVMRRIREMKLEIAEAGDYTPKESTYILLDICEKALKKLMKTIDKSFSELNVYLKSVNSFLNRKTIEVVSQSENIFLPGIRLRLEDIPSEQINSSDTFSDEEMENNDNYIELSTNGISKGYQKLSSGEKQIISLLYAAQISDQETILIDEPEISLHTDWQERLLSQMTEKLNQKQIIVCTHSPMIGDQNISDDAFQGMHVSPTNRQNWSFTPDITVLEDDKDQHEEEIEHQSEYLGEDVDVILGYVAPDDDS